MTYYDLKNVKTVLSALSVQSAVSCFWCCLVLFGAVWRSLVLNFIFDFLIAANVFRNHLRRSFFAQRLDVDILYSILVAGMTRVMHFEGLASEPNRSRHGANRTNPRYSEASPSYRTISRTRSPASQLHQLAATCTNLQEKKLRANGEPVFSAAPRTNTDKTLPHAC